MLSPKDISARLAATAAAARWQCDVSSLREPVHRLSVRMNDLPPHIQFNALMVAAAVACQALDLDPHEELARALRKVPDAETSFTAHVQAFRDYCRNELARVTDYGTLTP